MDDDVMAGGWLKAWWKTDITSICKRNFVSDDELREISAAKRRNAEARERATPR